MWQSKNLSSRVSCVNVAVAEQTGSVEFLCSKDNTGGSKIKPEHLDVDFRYDQPESIEDATMPLDTLFSGKSFDFILMDIEGVDSPQSGVGEICFPVVESLWSGLYRVILNGLWAFRYLISLKHCYLSTSIMSSFLASGLKEIFAKCYYRPFY